MGFRERFRYLLPSGPLRLPLSLLPWQAAVKNRQTAMAGRGPVIVIIVIIIIIIVIIVIVMPVEEKVGLRRLAFVC